MKSAFPLHNPPSIETGMTLRDYFAAAALTGLSMRGVSISHISEIAYSYADAMIKERENERT